MTADQQSDLDVILPDTATVAVGSTKCRVKRVRTRELFMLARILTNGAGRSIQHIDFKGDEAREQVIAALVMAVPEAPDEVLDLVKALLHPADPISKEEMAGLQAELDNPDPDVIIDVIEVVADQERDTIGLLVGKVTKLLEKIGKGSSQPAKRGSTRTRGTGSSTRGAAPST
jgi:hypothetical protein